MAKRRVAGPGRLGSISAAKKSAKAGGNSQVRTIPGEGSLTVRFLEEPSEWYGFYEHYDPVLKYFPCTGDDCPGCQNPSEDGSKSFRYLANAYVVDDSKVMAVKMPKSLVEQLLVYYEKFKTSLDRDYDLSKSGSGKNDTRYMASPDSPSKMKTSRFKLLDLDDVLESLISDDEDEPVKAKKGKKSARKVVDEDEDPWDDEDDEDDDDDDDDDEDEKPRKKKSSKPVVKKKSSSSKSSKTSKKVVSKPVRKIRK